MAGAAAWGRRGSGRRGLCVGQTVSTGVQPCGYLQSSRSAFSLVSLIRIQYDARPTGLQCLSKLGAMQGEAELSI